jgi:hypothetical protein
MSRASGSRLSKHSQGQDLNRLGIGKRFKIKQGGKFKGPLGIDPMYGKVSEIITHGAEFINLQQFTEVYKLSHQG